MFAPVNIAEHPHYEVHSAELAEWVEQQGAEQWWSVGSDRYLGERLGGPCRSDELARVLRRANRSLLVLEPQKSPTAQGQQITAAEIGSLLQKTDTTVFELNKVAIPRWAHDRYLWLSWKGESGAWELSEDSDATEAFRNIRTHAVV